VCTFCIEKLSSSQAWNDKYCSLLALGALFEYTGSNDYFTNVLSDKVMSLLSLFEDSSKTVRKTVSWVFAKIASNVPILIGNEEVLNKLYELCV